MDNTPQTSVLFVCLGNICRSPTAHGVFQALVNQRGLSGRIGVDSCGTSAWHIGEAPDRRSTRAALRRGYDLRDLRARQFSAADFDQFHYILAMDNANLEALQASCPPDYSGHMGLFLAFAEGVEEEVPDPYYGGVDGFSHALDLVEAASEGLLQEVISAHTAR